MTREEAQERLNSLRNKTKEIHILDVLEALELIKFEDKDTKYKELLSRYEQ